MRFYTAKGLGLRLAACAALLLIAAGFAPQSWPRESVMFQRHEIDQWRTNRIIVKWRTTGVAAVQMDSIADRATRLSQLNGIHVTPSHNLYGRTDVMLLDYTPTRAQMQQILGALNADPAVEYAEPDGYRFIQQFTAALPNDPHFVAGTDSFGSWVGQWYLQPSSSTTPAAISATTAWKTTVGTSNVVVAVLDTGIIEDHPDLAQNLQLPGYDFVSCDQGNFNSTVTTSLGATQGVDLCSASGSAATYYAANDGKDWHADASDPGDFIDSTDIQTAFFISNGCTTEEPSSWHGTKIAGVIGAVADNGKGTVGVAPSAKVLPVRVVGTCLGARVSDIAAAILWAAGQPVTLSTGSIQSSPAANIINISLGSPSACSATEQDAINTVTDAGVLVVAAAGNEGGAMDAPANCTGVVSVVGLTHTGDKTPFSSLSSEGVAASIAAPAGDCVNTEVTRPCLYDIETTSDAGVTSPSPTADVSPGFYTYALLDQSYLNSDGNSENEANIGTSFAAPMVAGVAALMRAANPSLSASQIAARLQSSALAFPTSSPGSSPKPGQCALASSQAGSNGNFSAPATPVECLCTTQTCGAGMLNAAAAVTAAQAAFVQIVPSHTRGVPGQKISLDGSGSTAQEGHTIVSYQWVTVPAISDQLINANEATATLIVPSFRSIGVMLTITDDAGNQTSGSVTIDSAFGGGKTGGAFHPVWLLALGMLAAWVVARRRGSSWN